MDPVEIHHSFLACADDVGAYDGHSKKTGNFVRMNLRWHPLIPFVVYSTFLTRSGCWRFVVHSFTDRVLRLRLAAFIPRCLAFLASE